MSPANRSISEGQDGGAQPLVAVIIPVYNARPYVRAAVDSVLAQTHRALDVIVIDDGSTDGSLDALADIRDPRLRTVRQENAGKPVAMNRALAMTEAEFYVVNDADDLSHPTRIERQVACLRANPRLAGVFTGHEVILHGKKMAPQYRAKTEQECEQDVKAFRMPGHDPTPMYRMSLVRGVTFDPALPVAEGLDYILRIGEQHPFVVLGECLYSYRIHPESITKRSRDLCNACVWEALGRACARRGLNFDDVFGATRADAETRPPTNKDLDNNIAAHFIESVLDLRSMGRKLEAIGTGLRCAGLHPTDPHYLKALAYAVLPRSIVARLRAQRQQLSTPGGEQQK